jgi:hypothetical protein
MSVRFDQPPDGVCHVITAAASIRALSLRNQTSSFSPARSNIGPAYVAFVIPLRPADCSSAFIDAVSRSCSRRERSM